jgi:hypothetical protein
MAGQADMRATVAFHAHLLVVAAILFVAFPVFLNAQSSTANPQQSKPSVFHVKYVSEGSVYIDAGRNADLQEGMKLSVIDSPADGMINDGIRFRGYPHIAELNLVSLADTSAVCDVVSSKGELKTGQLAFLTPGSVEDRHLAENAREAENYPVTVGFTSGDPLDQELRSSRSDNPSFPDSPLGVMRARVGFGYGGISESGMDSTQLNMMIDADMNLIGGSYWNFNGYWRGNYNTSAQVLPGAGTQTLTDLINRTYQIGFTYNSPYSPNTVGVGRLFLPWAPSLSTIDGGYYGRHFDNFFTVGVFGGSTPNPASWSYNPDQQIGGTFISMEHGDFDGFHMMSTAGLAVTSIDWQVAREFAFFENDFNWKRYLSFYSSMQVDEARTSPLPEEGSNPTGISQTYNSVHFQLIPLFTFGANYNYFRTLPTFDPKLIGTGLVDNYLFQGFSGDVRVDLPKQISLYAGIGQSKASTDTKRSLNDAFGIGFGNLFRTGLSLDLHYTKFNSTFGSGEYESVSVSRNITEKLRLQILGGNQTFDSPLTANTNAKFVNAILDWSIGRRYFVEGLYGWYNGNVLSYNQWSTLFGYRWGGVGR